MKSLEKGKMVDLDVTFAVKNWIVYLTSYLTYSVSDVLNKQKRVFFVKFNSGTMLQILHFKIN